MDVVLDQAQQEAVDAVENILCCACPGSGKTRVLVAKVTHVLKTHPDPFIIMTTFSRDAADEMLKRIKEVQKKEIRAGIKNPLTNEQMKRLTIGTFHSLALRQIRAIGKVGKILSAIETRHLIFRSLHESRLEISPEDADAYISRCKADKAFAEAHPDYARLTACYCRLQAELGRQDFTDMLMQANQLMASGKIKPIRATHVLADEYQDIDALQFDWLMHHLAQNPVACAVGDDDQSIYGFRRAMGYRGMMDYVAATNAKIIKLDTNYRSTRGLVESTSKLIGYNLDRVSKKIKTARGDGPSPKTVVLAKEDDQALRIIHLLDEICADNTMPARAAGDAPYRFAVRAGQAAVLTRTNIHLNAIERVFRQANVPCLRLGRAFWDTPVLQVYLTLLQSLVSQEGMGLEIALRWAQVSEAKIRNLLQQTDGNLWTLIDPQTPVIKGGSGNAALDQLMVQGRGWRQKLDGLTENDAAEGVIIGVTGWMNGVLTQRNSLDDDGVTIRGSGKQQIMGLDHIKAASDTLYAKRGSLQNRLMSLQRNESEEIPRVILATFHASKGLEWEHVFLADVYGGVVPKITEDATDEEVDEERRVFYVAMTRARDSLTIFGRADKPVCEFLADAGLS
jgi:superfamily I DNA/RNA helicase